MTKISSKPALLLLPVLLLALSGPDGPGADPGNRGPAASSFAAPPGSPQRIATWNAPPVDAAALLARRRR